MSKHILATLLLFTTLSVSSTSLEKLPTHIHSEVNCLAQTIYHEARGEPLAGQLAVANVTMNRVYSGTFPNSVCKVVYQRGQFSWTTKKTPTRNIPKEFVDMATRVIIHERADNTNGSLFFANKSVPVKRRQAKRIGNHIFYK